MQKTNEIACQLWSIAHDHGHIGLELEFRLGQTLPGNYFSANVGKDNFEKLKNTLNSSPKFDRVVDIETVETIQNTLKHAVNQNHSVKHVATISMCDPHPHPPPPPYCMTKTKVFQTEFDAGTLTARCCIAIEQPVPLRAVHSRFVRMKKRRRYTYRCWAFDLTEVVSNADIDTEETYEVEVELVDPGILLERTMDSVVEWGTMLINDLAKLMK